MCIHHGKLDNYHYCNNYGYPMLCTVGLMTALWRNDKSVRKWHLPRPCATFRDKYNRIQDQLKSLSCMDELLSGKYFLPPVYHSCSEHINHTIVCKQTCRNVKQGKGADSTCRCISACSIQHQHASRNSRRD